MTRFGAAGGKNLIRKGFECVMRKQSTGFILRGFAIIALAFVLTFAVLIFVSRPVSSSDGVLTHIHVDLLQDMLSASMKGMSKKEAEAYILKLSDPVFDDARLMPLDEHTVQQLMSNTGLRLAQFEISSINNGEAMIAEMHPHMRMREREKNREHDRRSPRGIDKFGRSKRLDDMHPPFVFDSKFLGAWLGFESHEPPERMPPMEDRLYQPQAWITKNEALGRQEEVNVDTEDYTLDAAGDDENTHATNLDGDNNDLVRGGDKDKKFHYEKGKKSKRNRVHYLIMPLESCQQLLYVRYEQPVGPLIPPASMVWGTIIVLMIMLVTALGLILPTILRIQKYESVCETVAKGNYAARCNDKRNDTLGLLARHIDEMTVSIQNNFDRQKLLLQAVAHEMRTPLARVRFSLEMLDIPEDDEMRMARLKSIDEDLEEVDALIKELNYFNYVDAGNGRQYFEENDVGEMIRVAIKKCSPTLAKFNLSVEGLEQADWTLMVDAKSFRHVIVNLLENAQRYAKENIAIIVQKSDDKKYLNISVEDDGPGIPVESRKLVLEPFASVDKSRNKAHSGFGLGLAIVDRTIKVHKGNFLIEDSKLGGCRMLTQWPLQQS